MVEKRRNFFTRPAPSRIKINDHRNTARGKLIVKLASGVDLNHFFGNVYFFGLWLKRYTPFDPVLGPSGTSDYWELNQSREKNHPASLPETGRLPLNEPLQRSPHLL